MKRILVCGSRTWADEELLARFLAGWLDRDRTLIHGAAPRGVDALAARYALTYGIPMVPFPADWEVHPDTPLAAIRTRADGTRYNAWAGGQRNTRMLLQGQPEIVLAFVDKPLGRSKGTNDMVNQARRANVPVVVTEYR